MTTAFHLALIVGACYVVYRLICWLDARDDRMDEDLRRNIEAMIVARKLDRLLEEGRAPTHLTHNGIEFPVNSWDECLDLANELAWLDLLPETDEKTA